MNLVGKIFVFLIMVMSVCFAMLAISVYMAHINWREKMLNPVAQATATKPAGLKFQLQSQKDETVKLVAAKEDQINKLKSEIAVKQQALIKSETAKVVLATENKQLHKDNEGLKTIQEGKLATVQATQQEIAALYAQNKILKEEIRDARAKIDEQFKQALEVTEQNHGLTLRVKDLQTRNEQLVALVATAKLKLAIHNDTLESPIEKGEPVISGVVKGVRVEGRTIYVQLSIGSDDGLMKGHMLDIFRGSKPLGRVVIISTEPDKSVGRVENATGQIQIRDEVASRRSLTQTAGRN